MMLVTSGIYWSKELNYPVIILRIEPTHVTFFKSGRPHIRRRVNRQEFLERYELRLDYKRDRSSRLDDEGGDGNGQDEIHGKKRKRRTP